MDKNVNKKLEEIRNLNHQKFYKLDINFLENVDKRYKIEAAKIIDEYKMLDSSKLLSDNLENSIINKKKITKIANEINLLKKHVSDDLKILNDYIDKLEDKIDISQVDKEDSLGILINNKYQSLKLFDSTLDFDNINFEMKNQTKRLVYIKELDKLIKNYNSHSFYNKNNTVNLINNLYYIIGNYLYLLSDVEFNYVKEAIKKILSYEYDFMNKFLPTYRIIMNKIWKDSLSSLSFDKNEFCYLVCDLNLEDDSLFVLNNKNISDYSESGYICQLPDNYLMFANLDKLEILNLPLPDLIDKKYKLDFKNLNGDDINIKAIYTKTGRINFDSILPVVNLNNIG